jgi:hypothetical protein
MTTSFGARIGMTAFFFLLLSTIAVCRVFAAGEPAWMNNSNAPTPKLSTVITEKDVQTAAGLPGIAAVPANTGAGWTGELNFAYPNKDTRALLVNIFNEKRATEKNVFQRFCGKVGTNPKYHALTGIGDNACYFSGAARDVVLYFKKGDLTVSLTSPSVPASTGQLPAPLTTEQVQAIATFIASKL